jgi:hypothetical protein
LRKLKRPLADEDELEIAWLYLVGDRQQSFRDSLCSRVKVATVTAVPFA